jgi:hypothetical protein
MAMMKLWKKLASIGEAAPAPHQDNVDRLALRSRIDRRRAGFAAQVHRLATEMIMTPAKASRRRLCAG